ncbi:TRP-domain-containing protein [Myriangium duriaei CBS 260.36]|uniref:TRP-domain-containing protein n=1 Tax=Myriangium duriaei CBS 260.36 TaxID=1168546 RepID=A0A9P4IWW5_9PEZI|nr:TRP-domain-containing protein [Myriangium duriaei CBS 260.36]
MSSVASATNGILQTSSLATCQDNSKLTATLFDVVYTANNRTLNFDIIGTSTVTGNVTIDLRVNAYGLQAYKNIINPCTSNLQGMCPMTAGPINILSNQDIDADSAKQIPGIAYSVPDLDASVTIYINSTTTGESLACVRAELSNGKTVYIPAVCWVIAVITGLGLIAAAVASGLGHSNTAAHVAANTMSLFGYFQAQAFIGMTAVSLPPIVASWTQVFQWSMGIIRVGFIQTLATWYQRATGGTPSTVLSDLSTVSVQVEKRSLETVHRLLARSVQYLHQGLLRRATSETNTANNNVVILRGIKRVGFRAGIELTNIFMTGYVFFIIFVIFVVLFVVLFKLFCEALVRAGRMKGDKFIDFRNGWTTVLKGILFRVALISFPQMVVLCFWELTVRDSPAIVVLGIFTVFSLLAVLAWAASKVIRLARRSINMHKNPAYILYSDPVTLNKWGFLYVSYKATAYYWLVVALLFTMVKGLFVALGQGSGIVQAVSLLIIDAAYFIMLCILTPYMDKKTNGFNIAIQVINFINTIFLLVFTNVFSAPGIVVGAMGVIFFFINAVFSLVLLILLLVASGFALFSKNPDVRYAPMRDDRGSFIKSQSHLPNELDALGATARGEGRLGQKSARIEDDEDGYSSSDVSRVGGNSSSMAGRYADQPAPNSPHTGYSNGMYQNEKSSGYYQPVAPRSGANSPAPGARGPVGRSPAWQRGAGYD